MMNYLDFLIIYLACGSPFGVYYFLDQRTEKTFIYVRSILAAVCWVPYAVKLLHQKVTNGLNSSQNSVNNLLDSSNSQKVEKLKKKFEDFLPDSHLGTSLYELREITERYAGLTQAISEDSNDPSEHELEIYKITDNSNEQISANCLMRRNRRKLEFHQTHARKDFLNLITELAEVNSDKNKLGNLSAEFVKILNDQQALSQLAQIFDKNLQNNTAANVNTSENDLWNPQEKQHLLNPLSTRLETLTATINPPKKD